MSAKHTPGPWKFSSETGRIFYVDKISGEEPPICDMDVPDIMAIENDEEVAANARLIAAAPEMLEALKAMMPWFCPDERAADCKITAFQVLRLIAKAEGTSWCEACDSPESDCDCLGPRGAT